MDDLVKYQSGKEKTYSSGGFFFNAYEGDWFYKSFIC